MYVLNDIRAEIETPLPEVLEAAARRSGFPVSSAFLLRRAVDARRQIPVFVYSVGFDVPFKGEKTGLQWHEEYRVAPPRGSGKLYGRPVVVGLGPAGMFCALALAEAGYRPVVLERGDDVDKRTEKVNAFFSSGMLDPECNVQFGAGGAGTYSDGKLNTRINDPCCRYILRRFVEFGAPDRILWQAKPHIGTDILRTVVKNICRAIEEKGGEIRYRSPLTGLDVAGVEVSAARVAGVERIKTNCLVLATGHSARDVFSFASDMGLAMSPKAFSVGVRIEHRQCDIDEALYHDYAGHPMLGPAEYALSLRKGERGVYTFCMCPGGQVIAAASESGGVVTNGMSNSARNGENGNAAVCVSVLPGDLGEDLFAGVRFQRQLEQAAFAAGGEYRAPAQTVGDYLDKKPSLSFAGVRPSYPRGVVGCDLSRLFPDFVNSYLETGLTGFCRQASFFTDRQAVLTGVETRTSSPIRIERTEDGMSPTLQGLYPCGEGAGHAGGIMSAAADGLHIAEKIMARFETE